MAKRAVELDPVGLYWNTLAVAWYYAGEYEGAIGAFEESLRSEDGTTLDVIGLALAHHRLGRQADAEAWYDRALREVEGLELDPDTITLMREAKLLFR